MAKVNKIFLNNFRNFRKYETTFNNSLNIFYGNNGSGKTNILESISLISKGRGIRNASISDLITHSEKNFLIKSLIEINKTVYEVEVKSFKNNDRLKKITNLNVHQKTL